MCAVEMVSSIRCVVLYTACRSVVVPRAWSMTLDSLKVFKAFIQAFPTCYLYKYAKVAMSLVCVVEACR